MNYLAHIFLAGTNPEAQLGGLLGDFVKPGFAGVFETTIEREIRLHRLIDTFTDSHPVVLSAKAKFRRSTRRFSGVILDILYDHFLASAWASYSQDNIEQFIQRFYAYLLKVEMSLPERLVRITPYMTKQDWLGSYREFAGFENAIHGVSRRVSKRAEELISGLEDVALNITDFREGFDVFFPELQSYVHRERYRLEKLAL